MSHGTVFYMFVLHVCVCIALLMPYKFYVLGQIGLSKQCRPRSDSTLFAIPSACFGCINAMLHQTLLLLGQLWQLFEVSQILEFLRYLHDAWHLSYLGYS